MGSGKREFGFGRAGANCLPFQITCQRSAVGLPSIKSASPFFSPEAGHGNISGVPALTMKKRILFVEDNPLLVSLYAMMLEGEQEHWEVSTARDGEQALALMAQTPFDVVVSDMGLPGMSGIELIDQVKHRYPGCCRIILSGLSDQQEVVRCLNATHQFLAKPFNVKALKATLARIGALDAFLADEALKSLVGQLGTLPSFPSLYVEIMKELGAAEPSVERIANIVSHDPSMTAKLLQIANSAALGLARELSSPFEAVQHLGLGTVRSLALAVPIFSCFEQTHLQGFFCQLTLGPRRADRGDCPAAHAA